MDKIAIDANFCYGLSKNGKNCVFVEVFLPDGFKKVYFPQSDEERYIFYNQMKGDSR